MFGSSEFRFEESVDRCLSERYQSISTGLCKFTESEHGHVEEKGERSKKFWCSEFANGSSKSFVANSRTFVADEQFKRREKVNESGRVVAELHSNEENSFVEEKVKVSLFGKIFDRKSLR